MTYLDTLRHGALALALVVGFAVLIPLAVFAVVLPGHETTNDDRAESDRLPASWFAYGADRAGTRFCGFAGAISFGYLTYRSLVHVMNSTVVRLADGELTLETGPLPRPSERLWPMAAVERFVSESDGASWTVEAELENGGRERIIRLSSRKAAQAMVRLLAEAKEAEGSG